MSVAACWMPDDSLRQARAVRPVAKVVEQWSSVWFAGPGCAVDGCWQPLSDEPGRASHLRTSGSWLVSGEKGAVMQIGCAALGEPERTDFTAADLRLLRRVAGEALDDLAERLDAIVPRQPDRREERSGKRWMVSVILAGHPCLELSLDRDILSTLAKQTYRAEGQLSSLDGIPSAIDDLAVPVAGHLGSSSLALEQIASLEPGDILLLDQIVDEPVTLVIGGRRSPLRCMISQSGEAFGLTVCEPQ